MEGISKYRDYRLKWIGKILFLTALIGFILHKLMAAGVSEYRLMLSNISYSPHYAILAIGLMPVNWFLEARKWQLLVGEFQRLSVRSSFLSVLSGISTGMITPNRIGNFIGRLKVIDRVHRKQAIVMTVISNVSQFVITVFLGLLGLIYYGWSSELLYAHILILFGLCALFVAVYIFFRPSVLAHSRWRRYMSKELQAAMDRAQSMDSAIKWQILGLSLIRYLVFLTQFVLLLWCLEVDVSWALLTAATAVVHLITTLIPSLLFGKLFVREASALFVLTELDLSAAVIVGAVFIIWVINIGIPGMIGGSILMRS